MPRLFLPVLTGALSPLAISRAPQVSDDSLLLSASAAGVLFSLLVASTSSSFEDMRLAVRVGDWRLPFAQRWKLVRAVGALVIGWAGVASVLAVR